MADLSVPCASGQRVPPEEVRARTSVTEVTAHPEEIQHVRREANERLRQWGHGKRVRQIVAQGISELLTNVHKHVGHGAKCTLTLAERDEGVLVMVEDASPRMAVPAEVAWDAETGRGLFLLQAMVTELVSRPVPTGKVVSFLVSREEEVPADAWGRPPA